MSIQKKKYAYGAKSKVEEDIYIEATKLGVRFLPYPGDDPELMAKLAAFVPDPDDDRFEFPKLDDKLDDAEKERRLTLRKLPMMYAHYFKKAKEAYIRRHGSLDNIKLSYNNEIPRMSVEEYLRMTGKPDLSSCIIRQPFLSTDEDHEEMKKQQKSQNLDNNQHRMRFSDLLLRNNEIAKLEDYSLRKSASAHYASSSSFAKKIPSVGNILHVGKLARQFTLRRY